MKHLPWKGRGQGHVSNFYYIMDLENFTTASRRYRDDIHNSVRGRFAYDTYKTMEASRSRHGWVHMFITHWLTVTLQLHNFDLFRTCRTSSFCTVAWQLARFQLTCRIARSLGDSWHSCNFFLPAQRYVRASTSYGLVSVCVRPSQVGVLSKRMNEWSWLWHRSFLRLHCLCTHCF